MHSVQRSERMQISRAAVNGNFAFSLMPCPMPRLCCWRDEDASPPPRILKVIEAGSNQVEDQKPAAAVLSLPNPWQNDR
jgi:hypothetical protein